MKIAILICFIIAGCAIGFGVWCKIDGDSQKEQLNAQIASLKEQNNTLSERVFELTNGKEGTSTPSEDYFYLKKNGIKIKKSSNLKDVVVNETSDTVFEIKENSSADSNPPSTVSFMRVNTCNDSELTLGYSLKINVAGTCYIMGSILPYGSDSDYPLTDFLKYVLDESIYSAYSESSSSQSQKADSSVILNVTSIGDCVFDNGDIAILKCEASTSDGKGKFVWDSESNELRFVLPPKQ